MPSISQKWWKSVIQSYKNSINWFMRHLTRQIMTYTIRVRIQSHKEHFRFGYVYDKHIIYVGHARKIGYDLNLCHQWCTLCQQNIGINSKQNSFSFELTRNSILGQTKTHLFKQNRIFGRFSWAILTARVCQLYPNANASQIIQKFYHTWNCHSPFNAIMLSDTYENMSEIKVWDPYEQQSTDPLDVCMSSPLSSLPWIHRTMSQFLRFKS